MLVVECFSKFPSIITVNAVNAVNAMKVRPHQGLMLSPYSVNERVPLNHGMQAWDFVILGARPPGLKRGNFFEGTKATCQGIKAISINMILISLK